MTFKWIAQQYVKARSVQDYLVLPILQNHSDQLFSNNNKTILDIGCGDGKYTNYISEQIPTSQVIGIDQSQDMINFAKKNYEKTDQSLTFQHKNAYDVSFPNNYFDVIVSFNCLHWIDNISYIFTKTIYEKLSHSGLFLACHDLKPPEPFWSIAECVRKTSQWEKYFTDFTLPYFYNGEPNYYNLLENTGFTNIVITQKKDVFKFTSTEDAINNNVRGWLPHLNHLHSTKQNEFLKAFANECNRSDIFDKQKRLIYEQHIGLIYALK